MEPIDLHPLLQRAIDLLAVEECPRCSGMLAKPPENCDWCQGRQRLVDAYLAWHKDDDDNSRLKI